MSDSPVPTSRQSETEMISASPGVRISTPIDEASISEKNDLPILFEPNDRKSSVSSHVDENNENEAVGNTREKNVLFNK